MDSGISFDIKKEIQKPSTLILRTLCSVKEIQYHISSLKYVEGKVMESSYLMGSALKIGKM